MCKSIKSACARVAGSARRAGEMAVDILVTLAFFYVLLLIAAIVFWIFSGDDDDV